MKEKSEERRTLDDGNSLQLRAWLKLAQTPAVLNPLEVGTLKNR